MVATASRSGFSKLSTRFQLTKNRVCTSAFAAPNVAAVNAFHAAALRGGGHDNGAPGLRPIYGPDYYAAFMIDPNGYRIEAYFGPSES